MSHCRGLVALILTVIALSGCAGSTTSEPPPTSAAAPPQVITDRLNGGRYLFGPWEGLGALRLAATGPDGWVGYRDWAMDGPEPVRADAPKGIGISFFPANGVFSDPCHWDWNGTGQSDRGDVKVGPTVDDLVAALHANTYYSSTAPRRVTIDGYSGEEIELQMPDGSYAHCDKDDPRDPGGHVFVFSGPGLYTQGPANHWDVYVLDVDGARLIAVIMSYAKTPQTDLDTADAIIRTLDIDPQGTPV